jgi:hypothetical protein
MSPDSTRFLVISRAGPDSLHREWCCPRADRSFDVLLSAYDSKVADPCQSGVVFEYRPGKKVAGYGEVLRDHADLIARYDYVALFDDDLLISARDMQRLFDIVALHQLKIAQPALSHDSYFTFAALLKNPAFRLRYVNYIEMMCPVFRGDVLNAIRPLYDLGFESGIDLIWCNLVATSLQDFAVIDDVTVRHTRPVGAHKSANGFIGSRRYEDDIYALLARFDLPWLSCVPYAGIRRNGTVTRRRSAFFWSSLALLFVVAQRSGLRGRLRSVAVYWKHLLSRPARNIPVTLT